MTEKLADTDTATTAAASGVGGAAKAKPTRAEAELLKRILALEAKVREQEETLLRHRYMFDLLSYFSKQAAWQAVFFKGQYHLAYEAHILQGPDPSWADKDEPSYTPDEDKLNEDLKKWGKK